MPSSLFLAGHLLAPTARRVGRHALHLAAFSCLLAVASHSAHAGTIIASDSRLPSVVLGNNNSSTSSISADGTKVAFVSLASNLVNGDTNNVSDVFLKDLSTGVTIRVSTDSSGNQGNQNSIAPNISADGTKVAFQSLANNLVSGDTNGVADIFVHDLTTGMTTRVSLDSDGNQANAASTATRFNLSADGNKVVFLSGASNLVSGDTNNTTDVFVRDVAAGTTTRVSTDSSDNQGNNDCDNPIISPNGSKVAFESKANNLVSGDTNGVPDIFVRDLTTGTTTRASLDSDGNQVNGYSFYPSFNADGTKIAFGSDATNLVGSDTNSTTDVFVRDLDTGTTTLVSLDSNGNQSNGSSPLVSLSGDGNKVVFRSLADNLVSGDTNGFNDIFVRDLTTGITTLVSTDSSGNQTNNISTFPVISANGTRVAFYSNASNLIDGDTNGLFDVFVKDLTTGTTLCASVVGNPAGDIVVAPGNGASNGRTFSLSADGTRVAFSSNATNLVTGDTNGSTDIFVRDLVTGLTTRVSIHTNGAQSNGNSFNPSISADGTKVVFQSNADTLVAGDTNGITDIFVRDLTAGTTTRVSTDSSGNQGDNSSQLGVISGDGTKVAFASNATNLVPGDTNDHSDVFVKDLTTGAITRASTDSTGSQINEDSNLGSLSGDGSKVAFSSIAGNLVAGDTNGQADIFVKDLTSGTVVRASTDSSGNQGNSYSIIGNLNSDGTRIAFQSNADNLVAGDGNGQVDIFVKDLNTGAITRANTDSSGNEANSFSFDSSLSADGTKVAFTSNANNLVPGDNNGQYDAFVKDLNSGVIILASTDSSGAIGNSFSATPSLSGDGTRISYQSLASNLVAGDTNNTMDVFVSDVVTETLSIGDASLTEGNSGTTNMVFTVSLSKARSLSVTVQYALTDGTTTGADYGTASDSDGGTPGTLTIPVGQTSGTITVPINGDRTAETDETFFVNLSNVSGAILGDAQGVGTITNDDHAPTAISLSRQWIREKAGANAFVAGLSATDADTGESFTYTLPVGVDDNSAFSIDGTNLRAAQDFDFATKASYTLTIQVADSGGNTYQQQFTISVQESTKPTVTISAPTVGQKILKSDFPTSSINGTATDNVGVTAVKVRLSRKRVGVNQFWNGSGFLPTQSYLNATVSPPGASSVTWNLDGQMPPVSHLDAGVYDLQVYATDAAGNQSAYVSLSFNIVGDVIAPTLAITSPTPNQKILLGTVNGNTIKGTANDDIVVRTVKVRLSRKRGTSNTYWNGVDFVAASSSWVEATVINGPNWKLGTNMPPINKLDSGAYQVEAYAVDAGGNRSATAKVVFSLNTDYTAPSVSISTPTSSQVIKINEFTAGTLTGTASDDIGVTSVKLKLQRKRNNVLEYWNGTAFTTTVALVDATVDGTSSTWSYDTPIPASALDRGGYSAYATAYDATGNFKTSASRTFSIVGTPSASDAVSAADKSAGKS